MYIDFQTSHFADYEQFKVDIYFADFGEVAIILHLGKTCLED